MLVSGKEMLEEALTVAIGTAHGVYRKTPELRTFGSAGKL